MDVVSFVCGSVGLVRSFLAVSMVAKVIVDVLLLPRGAFLALREASVESKDPGTASST
jgi:hypothetical protein